MSNGYKKQFTAFTLVEMLIVAPIVILMIGLIMNLMIQMTGEVMATRSAASITSDIQNALNTIENDVVNSGAFLATNNISLTSPQGRNDDTTAFQNANSTYGPAIILNSYGTTENPLKSELKYIYTKTPNSCGASTVSSNPRLMFNTVYFIKDSALWRRIIAADNYEVAGCEKPWQIPSCSLGVSGSFCKSDDKKMVEGVTADNLDISYYPDSASLIPNSIATDSAQSDAARQIALKENDTISITITSNITVAGRNITQTGTIRASSKNDYVTATPQKPVVTTQPTDVSKLDNNTNITFTAQAFDSTSVQWQVSTNKGVDWPNVVDGPNVVGATTTTLTLATINNTMDGYLYRAVFTNSEGSVNSNQARLNVGDSQWRVIGAAGQPAFKNGWTHYDNGYNTMAFRKTLSGVVIIRGLIDAGSSVSGTPITTLPEGYRPTKEGKLLFTTIVNPDVAGRIDVLENGDVTCVVCHTAWTSVEGIHYIPDNGRYPFNKVEVLSGWWNYGGAHAPAAYSVDDVNRVHLQGLVAASLGAQTNIFKIPSNLLPSQYMHIPAVSATNADFRVDYRQGVEGVVSVSNGYYRPLQLMYYPASQDSKWTNLTLSPLDSTKWTPYSLTPTIPEYSRPQYTKSADGLVSLKGLIKGGNTVYNSTVIAILPTGYRPSSRILHNAMASGPVYTRIDIRADGYIMFMTGNNNWYSLDGITFYADQ